MAYLIKVVSDSQGLSPPLLRERDRESIGINTLTTTNKYML